MATRNQTQPDLDTEASQQDPAAATPLSQDERAELERLRAAQAGQSTVEPLKEAVGGTYLVTWTAISVLAGDQASKDKDAPRFVLPKGAPEPVDGFVTLRRGSLVAGKNAAGDRHLQELATIGAVAAA